jgi:hypothetical protein
MPGLEMPLHAAHVLLHGSLSCSMTGCLRRNMPVSALNGMEWNGRLANQLAANGTGMLAFYLAERTIGCLKPWLIRAPASSGRTGESFPQNCPLVLAPGGFTLFDMAQTVMSVTQTCVRM